MPSRSSVSTIRERMSCSVSCGAGGKEPSFSRIGHEQHVRLRDSLPAADRGAVEAEALVEGRLVEGRKRQGHVLPAPEQVAELEVDELRLGLARPLERIVSGWSLLGPVRDVVL